MKKLIVSVALVCVMFISIGAVTVGWNMGTKVIQWSSFYLGPVSGVLKVLDSSENVMLSVTDLGTTGKLTTSATSTAGAGLNLPHGTAPNTPANGDMWTTTTGLYTYINGGTVGPFADADAYQPLDTDLTAIAGLSSADSNIIVGSAGGWVAESGATARTSLGLGTGNSPSFAAVTAPTITSGVEDTTAGGVSIFGNATTTNPYLRFYPGGSYDDTTNYWEVGPTALGGYEGDFVIMPTNLSPNPSLLIDGATGAVTVPLFNASSGMNVGTGASGADDNELVVGMADAGAYALQAPTAYIQTGLGVGTGPPTFGIYSYTTPTADASANGVYGRLAPNATATSRSFTGLQGYVAPAGGTYTSVGMYGSYSWAQSNASVTVPTAVGAYAGISLAAAGTFTTAYVIQGVASGSTGAIGTLYGLSLSGLNNTTPSVIYGASIAAGGAIGNATSTTNKGVVIGNVGGAESTTTSGIELGTVTAKSGSTAYGLKIGNVSGATTNYAIYTGAGISHFGGAGEFIGGLNVGTNGSAADDDEIAIGVADQGAYSVSCVSVYATGDVSALTFTDRASAYKGEDALTEILCVDHTSDDTFHQTLPEAVKRQVKTIKKEVPEGEAPILDPDTGKVTNAVEIEVTEAGWDLGETVSMLTAAVQQLEERNKALETRIAELEKKPK